MATIISSNNQAYFSCDEAGCHEVSQKYIYGTNVIEIDEQARKRGWYVSTLLDMAYCPKHSPYNRKPFA